MQMLAAEAAMNEIVRSQYVNMSICQYVQVTQELLKTFLLMTEKTGEKLQTTLRSI